MAVAVFEKRGNRMISTCQNFGHKIYQCQTFEEVFTRGDYKVIFCLDKQACQELGEDKVLVLHTFKHPRNPLYVFGTDTGMKMAAEIQNLKDKKYHCVTIMASHNNVFWTEQAMSIILYDKWVKEQMDFVT